MNMHADPAWEQSGDRIRTGGTSHAERVFRVQQAFVKLRGRTHGPGELAEASGLDDSAVHRILQSGIYEGVFDRVGRGRYQLGTTAALVGMQAMAHTLDRHTARSVLLRLRAATGGGLAFLYTLAPFGGAQRQCVDMAVGDSDLSELGMTPREVLAVTRSLRVGASGRAILAYLPSPIQERVAAEPAVAEAGPGALADNDVLWDSLRDIRDRGYAIGLEECIAGWNSCAAPVMWDGWVFGAVLVLLPDAGAAHPDVIDATTTAATQLSLSLGPYHRMTG
ncbi:IclR family transcriptional regulator [Streptomyces sp. NPDC017638]|uniref:IclR family transcriptional regulator n=1 Tax=Streptomyces sp. NPDC017638 TaxID=3365004 RepID=UPI003794361E